MGGKKGRRGSSSGKSRKRRGRGYTSGKKSFTLRREEDKLQLFLTRSEEARLWLLEVLEHDEDVVEALGGHVMKQMLTKMTNGQVEDEEGGVVAEHLLTKVSGGGEAAMKVYEARGLNRRASQVEIERAQDEAAVAALVDLWDALQDGRILCRLMMVLSGGTSEYVGRWNKLCRSKHHALENVNAAVQSSAKIPGIELLEIQLCSATSLVNASGLPYVARWLEAVAGAAIRCGKTAIAWPNVEQGAIPFSEAQRERANLRLEMAERFDRAVSEKAPADGRQSSSRVKALRKAFLEPTEDPSSESPGGASPESVRDTPSPPVSVNHSPFMRRQSVASGLATSSGEIPGLEHLDEDLGETGSYTGELEHVADLALTTDSAITSAPMSLCEFEDDGLQREATVFTYGSHRKPCLKKWADTVTSDLDGKPPAADGGEATCALLTTAARAENDGRELAGAVVYVMLISKAVMDIMTPQEYDQTLKFIKECGKTPEVALDAAECPQWVQVHPMHRRESSSYQALLYLVPGLFFYMFSEMPSGLPVGCLQTGPWHPAFDQYTVQVLDTTMNCINVVAPDQQEFLYAGRNLASLQAQCELSVNLHPVCAVFSGMFDFDYFFDDGRDATAEGSELATPTTASVGNAGSPKINLRSMKKLENLPEKEENVDPVAAAKEATSARLGESQGRFVVDADGSTSIFTSADASRTVNTKAVGAVLGCGSNESFKLGIVDDAVALSPSTKMGAELEGFAPLPVFQQKYTRQVACGTTFTLFLDSFGHLYVSGDCPGVGSPSTGERPTVMSWFVINGWEVLRVAASCTQATVIARSRYDGECAIIAFGGTRGTKMVSGVRDPSVVEAFSQGKFVALVGKILARQRVVASAEAVTGKTVNRYVDQMRMVTDRIFIILTTGDMIHYDAGRARLRPPVLPRALRGSRLAHVRGGGSADRHTVFVAVCTERGEIWARGCNATGVLGVLPSVTQVSKSFLRVFPTKYQLAGWQERLQKTGKTEAEIKAIMDGPRPRELVATLLACGPANMFWMTQGGEMYGIGQSLTGVSYVCHPRRLATICPKIVSMSCGRGHVVLVDENGTVYGAGCAAAGSLGLWYKTLDAYGLAVGDLDRDPVPGGESSERGSVIRYGAQSRRACLDMDERPMPDPLRTFATHGALVSSVMDETSLFSQLLVLVTPAVLDLKPFLGSGAPGTLADKVVGVECGAHHTVLSLANGRVLTLGNAYSGQTGFGGGVMTAAVTRAAEARMDALQAYLLGDSSTSSLRTNAIGGPFILMRGFDEGLSLGQSLVLPSFVPVDPFRDTQLIAVEAGGRHSVALSADGQVYTWGSNEDGALGHGDLRERASPSVVGALSKKRIRAVCAGHAHTVAASVDGIVYAWGDATAGQLGVHRTDNQGAAGMSCVVAPEVAFRGLQVSMMACGKQHTVILGIDGSVFVAGTSDFGQLGHLQDEEEDETAELEVSQVPLNRGKLRRRSSVIRHLKTTRALHPVEALETVSVIAVACGDAHSVALAANGSVYQFGLTVLDGGAVGVVKPRRVTGPLLNHTVVQIACGAYHNLALTADGFVFGWGLNTRGQLGIPSAREVNEPVLIEALARAGPVTSVTTGAFHSFASVRRLVTDQGQTSNEDEPEETLTLYGFGSDDKHQLGEVLVNKDESGRAMKRGDAIGVPTPIQLFEDGVDVAGPVPLIVSGGLDHSFVVMSSTDS